MWRISVRAPRGILRATGFPYAEGSIRWCPSACSAPSAWLGQLMRSLWSGRAVGAPARTVRDRAYGLGVRRASALGGWLLFWARALRSLAQDLGA